MQNKIFYLISFSFLSGIFLASFYLPNLFWLLIASLVLLFLLFIFSFVFFNKKIFLFCLIFLFVVFGVVRFQLSQKNYLLDESLNKKVSLTVRIVEEPEQKENYQRLTVIVENQSKTKILTYVSPEGDFKYGDKIKIAGILEKPENFITETGKEFDYLNYLRKDNILYTMFFPEIEILARGEGNFLKSFLLSTKNKFQQKIKFNLPEPESILLGGLILGERSSFSQELRQNFIKTGTIHLVALSGYNVSIVAEWLMKIFSLLPLWISFSVGILAIFLFILMTGASTTAIRAGLMASLALLARATGREYQAGRILLLSAVVMIFINPWLLVYDVSFQLSFLATFAVIFLTPKLEKFFLWLPNFLKLREVLTVSTAAYLFVLPFVLYQMGNFSVIALPANFLILPFIPLTMALGFFCALTGFLNQFLASFFAFFSFHLLNTEIKLINFLANLSWSSLNLPNFPWFLVILIYLIFAYLFWREEIKRFFISSF